MNGKAQEEEDQDMAPVKDPEMVSGMDLEDLRDLKREMAKGEDLMNGMDLDIIAKDMNLFKIRQILQPSTTKLGIMNSILGKILLTNSPIAQSLGGDLKKTEIAQDGEVAKKVVSAEMEHPLLQDVSLVESDASLCVINWHAPFLLFQLLLLFSIVDLSKRKNKREKMRRASLSPTTAPATVREELLFPNLKSSSTIHLHSLIRSILYKEHQPKSSDHTSQMY